MRPTKALLIGVVALVTACGGRPGIDISDVQLERPFVRLDRILFHASPDSLVAAGLKAQAVAGTFYTIYLEQVLQLPADDARLPLMLHAFVTDPDWRQAQRGVDSVLGDLGPEQRRLEDALKRLKVLFPDSVAPHLVAYNSGYNYGIFPTDSVLGIGVEWFIGGEHPVVELLAAENFPAYIKARMRREMLVPSAMKGWLLVHYGRDTRGQELLAHMVNAGKVMYLLHQLLPGTDPAMLFAYTREQLDWCHQNEYAMWKRIVADDMLYSRRSADVGRFMGDGPFTNGFPRESPGRVGEFIGYRMVEAYMNAHPSTSIAELFALNDPRIILKSYKPR